MKTNNLILLYDDYCPLCSWYSGLFVKYKLLQPENRVAFSKAHKKLLIAIDIEKGKDEIPLVDPASKKTLYGIDALLEILGQKCTAIKSIGTTQPVYWFLKKLYMLISYNRKVIVARKCSTGAFDCSPGFNNFYRILFMAIFLCFNTLMLFALHHYVLTAVSLYHLNMIQLQTAHLLFVSINCLLTFSLKKHSAIEYLGQINLLALITILLLSPLIIAGRVVLLPEWLVLSYFLLLTIFIIKEYRRRMRYAGIGMYHKHISAINIICLAGFLLYVFH